MPREMESNDYYDNNMNKFDIGIYIILTYNEFKVILFIDRPVTETRR